MLLLVGPSHTGAMFHDELPDFLAEPREEALGKPLLGGWLLGAVGPVTLARARESGSWRIGLRSTPI